MTESNGAWSFSSTDGVAAMEAKDECMHALTAYFGAAIDESAIEIIFMELVGNVARHAPGPVEISLELHDTRAVLEVADTGPGFNLAPALPESLFSESGRGLFLVTHYAADVQTKPRDESLASVRVTLPLKRA